ncbi:MAG: flagellar hook-associated protein FlgL [Oryzomonas sp.]|jgi:flagellar hook-associated protein 3 FlgL
MRITSNMTANNAIYNLQKAQTTLNNLTELTTSEQNINQPSDNPAATNTLLNINDSLNAINQYSTNITNATTVLNVTNDALTGISSSIAQAQQVMSTMTSGSTDPSVRQSAYDQLATIKQQIIDYGNTQSGNTYVFGGTDSSTPPFSVVGATNTYNGNSTQSSVEVTTNSYQVVNITGDRLLGLPGASSSGPPIPSPSYGSTDILGTLDNLMAAVGNNATPSNVANIQQYSSALDAGATQINNATVDVAARMQRLTTMSTMNTNSQNTLQNVVGNIQSVDLATVGTELSQQQTAYQAALSATAQISKMSLLNYL